MRLQTFEQQPHVEILFTSGFIPHYNDVNQGVKTTTCSVIKFISWFSLALYSISSHPSDQAGRWTVSVHHTTSAVMSAKTLIYCCDTHTPTHPHSFELLFTGINQPHTNLILPSSVSFCFCFSGSKRDSYKWKCQHWSSYPILSTG